MVRTKMDRKQRAKQFAPFAALKGFEEALRDKEKIIVPKIELTDDMKEEINAKLLSLNKQDLITCIFYDSQTYVKVTGTIVEINAIKQYIKVVDTLIPFDNIRNLQEVDNDVL